MIALIPFRGDSKRVNLKNTKFFNNERLFAITAKQAFMSGCFDKIVLASDLREEIVNTYLRNSSVPPSKDIDFYKRNLVSDDEPAAVYITSVINQYEMEPTDSICLLQPTCPLRTLEDISLSVDKYLESPHETLVTVTPVANAKKLYIKNDDGTVKSVREGDLTCEGHNQQMLYKRNSSIYIFSVKFFTENGTIFADTAATHEMPWYRSVDIDSEADFRYGENLWTTI